MSTSWSGGLRRTSKRTRRKSTRACLQKLNSRRHALPIGCSTGRLSPPVRSCRASRYRRSSARFCCSANKPIVRHDSSSISTGHILTVAEQNWRESLRSEEHTSELQSLAYLVCRLLLEK